MRAPSLKATDFQRALGSRPVSRTSHFVLHVLPVMAVQTPQQPGLSTAGGAAGTVPVEDLVCASVPHAESGSDVVAPAWRFGLVLPKKQARRSVTRSLIRHQAREALRRHAAAVRACPAYADGVDGWVLRLKNPFDRQQFPSAASEALSAAVRTELDELWRQVLRPRRVAPPSPAMAPSGDRGAAA